MQYDITAKQFDPDSNSNSNFQKSFFVVLLLQYDAVHSIIRVKKTGPRRARPRRAQGAKRERALPASSHSAPRGPPRTALCNTRGESAWPAFGPEDRPRQGWRTRKRVAAAQEKMRPYAPRPRDQRAGSALLLVRISLAGGFFPLSRRDRCFFTYFFFNLFFVPPSHLTILLFSCLATLLTAPRR